MNLNYMMNNHKTRFYGYTEMTVARLCSGKHVIEVMGGIKQCNGNCEREKQ